MCERGDSFRTLNAKLKVKSEKFSTYQFSIVTVVDQQVSK
jgi:hypothetical protein